MKSIRLFQALVAISLMIGLALPAAASQDGLVPDIFTSGTGSDTSLTPPAPALQIKTNWKFEVVRHGRVIDAWEQSNVCTTEGLGAMFGNVFAEWSQVSPWFVMLFDNNMTASITEEYDSNNMSEVTAYSRPAGDGDLGGSGIYNRPVWHGATSGATKMTNSAQKAEFDIILPSGSTTAYGAALVSSGVSSDMPVAAASGNTLFSVAKFGSSRTLVNGDKIYVTVEYEIGN